MNNEIIVQTVASDKSPTQPNHNDKSNYALHGKFACLPGDIREELNLRLYNGKKGRQILAWLNELPAVKEILTAQFDGKALNKQNLSHWRQTGYQRWSRQKHNVGSIKDVRQFVTDITNAGVEGLTPATAALASAKMLQFLETLDPATTNPGDLAKCAAAIAILREKEQNEVRLKIAQHRSRQRDLALLLKKDKQQRDSVAIARRVLGDARAEAIENSSWSNAEKIEALGIHLFGHLWEPRPVPTSPQPSSSHVKA
ncbi:MAG TPA: hypothetical protein VNU95_00320 [Candidatus Acidoferrales bacterium]|jgi:hypothetical protein|nr:hypothetical protein [Candidatus Acidoferrales bacterium]